jgi:hypothetical protein
MKRTSLTRSMLPFVLACALGSGSSPARAADSDPQEAAITKTAEAFVEAFQKGDAKAVASFWTPDGDYGSYSHSGSTTATGRYGNTYSGSHASSGNYYHSGYSTGGYGAYHYGGCYGGGGFHAAAVSGPNGTAYASGVYRRRVW